MKAKNIGLAITLLFVTALGALFFVFQDKIIDSEPVNVVMPKKIYWNLKEPIKISFSDKSGIKYIKASVVDANRQTELLVKQLDDAPKALNLSLAYPKKAFVPQAGAVLRIETKDASWSTFISGKADVKEAELVADIKPPTVNIVANSYSISKGGAALVIFEAKDENLDAAFVKDNKGRVFKAQPFYKTGYYGSLIAWDILNDDFTADVVATDKAGNISQARVNFYKKDVAYKTSKIELKDDFLNAKIVELSKSMDAPPATAPLDKFIFVNEKLREQNEKNIEKISSVIGKDSFSSFFAVPFVPLRKAAVVATFGDHRLYFKDGKQVSTSYHMGLDLASVANADIMAPAPGAVMFAGENGIYGNMVALYHGLGLFTIYGHCNSITVKQGDVVKTGDVIAKTGLTGLAFGDHLHYGVIVQGVEVRPAEWLDAHWMKNNLTKIIEDAKKLIDGHKS